MNIIYKHAHLIINDTEEILDGSLLIVDNKIEKVSYKDIEKEDIEVIDLDGGIIMPANISFSEINKEIEITKNNELVIDSNIVGFYDFFNKNDSLSFDRDSNVNKAFLDEELYVVLKNIEDKPKEILNVILNTKLRDRIIIDGNLKLIKYLNEEYKLSLTDIVRFMSINPAKLLKIYNYEGSITKGKKANFLFLDKELNVIDRLIIE